MDGFGTVSFVLNNVSVHSSSNFCLGVITFR